MRIEAKVYLTPPAGFKPSVHVAGCCLIAEGKYLILKRHPKKPQGLTWGLPSGKLEKGETPLQAIIREVDEEIGVKLREKDLKYTDQFYVEHPDLHFCYHLYYVEFPQKIEFDLNLAEHTEARWLTPEDTKDLSLIGGSGEVQAHLFNLPAALERAFKGHASPVIAEKQKSYMRGQFPYYGIQKPLRAQLQKDIFIKHPILNQNHLEETVRQLWDRPEREHQYAAIALLKQRMKHSNAEWFPLIEYMLRTKSWWDSVDAIAADLLGPFLKRHPAYLKKMDRWIKDQDFWIRRAALIYQLHWKGDTDEKRLFDYCLSLSHEKEFFIQKAIGWALRQYARSKPDSVRQFLKQHKGSLSALSFREANKHL